MIILHAQLIIRIMEFFISQTFHQNEDMIEGFRFTFYMANLSVYTKKSLIFELTDGNNKIGLKLV